MHFSTIFTTIVAAGMASAASDKIVEVTEYNAVALHGNKETINAALQASNSRFALKLKNQHAACDRGLTENKVTFDINKDGELSLNTWGNNPQVAYVDRSGMGQGILAYATYGDKGFNYPKNAETKGWKVAKNGDLTFGGKGFLACPNSKKAGGSYTLWADVGIKNPGGNKNCQAITVRATKDKNPVSCVYSA
ncbi:cell wall protein [Fusarium pseudoanthophilum]|uniref:Cell wall protein n=1 Tax=Fusarium pseudoanthophilum TaxID=48495 RepID=A0A8H5NNW8_9HYPO|nr:cell wall protein [Fusarium pseudoanthophilum]